MACSPNRRLVAMAVCGDISGVWLVDPKSWKRLERMDGATDESIYGLWFAPDGKMLVALGEKGVHVWNLVTRQHRTIESRYSSDKFVGVTDNAKAVAFQSSGEIMFFSTSTGDLHMSFELLGKERDDGWALVSPVGSLVAIAYRGTVYLDDWATGESKGTLYSHEASVNQMAFSSDASLLATGDSQGRIKLWKVTGLVNNANKSDPAATTEPLKPADDKTAAPTTSSQPFPSPAADEQGFVSLFDGKTLDGWHANGRRSMDR